MNFLKRYLAWFDRFPLWIQIGIVIVLFFIVLLIICRETHRL